MDLLIDLGLNINETFKGDTLLHRAAWKGNSHTVKLLINRGLKSAIHSLNNDNYTALQLAIKGYLFAGSFAHIVSQFIALNYELTIEILLDQRLEQINETLNFIKNIEARSQTEISIKNKILNIINNIKE